MRNAFTALWLLLAAPALFADTLGKPAQLLISLKATVGTLHGTLELPAGPAPYPLALIIAGSGRTDQNGNAIALEEPANFPGW